MRLLITGADGLLGTELAQVAPVRDHEVVATDRTTLDVTDEAAVREALASHRPDAVLHCAAYTAVDRAEEEPEEARRVNVDGSAHVARAAADVGAVMVYVSTDFVFDGRSDRPYRPYDPPNPLGVYGATKLEGERAVAEVASQHLIVRTSWLYGKGGRNFVTAILERAASGQPLKVVNDQTGRPTWARNLAEAMLELLEREARGVWHVADADIATWYDFAVEALRLRGLTVDVEPVSTEAWGAPAPRPRYSALDIGATEAFLGRPMMLWMEALERFLEEI